VATAALRRKKAMDVELDRIGGTRLQLENQINTLESANINQETLTAMKKGSEALKQIHGRMYEFHLMIMKDHIDVVIDNLQGSP
jgi:charged multivesicular body protein 4A/B